MLRLKRWSTTLSGSAPSGFLLWSDQGKPSVRCQHSGAKLTNVVRGGWPGLLCVETDVSRIITCKSGGIKVNLLRWEQLWSYSCICFTFARIPVQPFCCIFSLSVWRYFGFIWQLGNHLKQLRWDISVFIVIYHASSAVGSRKWMLLKYIWMHKLQLMKMHYFFCTQC